jgi:hypothetical protein
MPQAQATSALFGAGAATNLAAPPPAEAVRAPSAKPTAPPPLPPALPINAAEVPPPVPLPADEPTSWSQTFGMLPSWMVSMVVHLVLVIVLALWMVPGSGGSGGGDTIEPLVSSLAEDDVSLESLDDLDEPETLEMPLDPLPQIQPMPIEPLAKIDEVTPQPADVADLTSPTTELADVGTLADPLAHLNDLASSALVIGRDPADMIKGRLSDANRRALLRQDGGTQASEEAVAKALRWLSKHQMYDGSWSFNHQRAPGCGNKCSHPGGLDRADVAATALGLLPFLGQGHTHKTGKYKDTVDKGLNYLVRSMRMTGSAGSLHQPGGTMYGHGLASMALCEAYAMTRDKKLRQPAQAAINFIVLAQDPTTGGWRYQPRQAGDTSVVGWQVMALKSGHLGYLDVPRETVGGASVFLDYVQDEYGSLYGYTGPGGGRATTAIGLLCRMYLGWPPTHESIRSGVQHLDKWGPSMAAGGSNRDVNNMYYNYYATQVMHHVGGDAWQRWNKQMRDYLIDSQGKSGHELGSWYLEGNDHGLHQGGRLYCTSMSAMTLEVYYRHLPLYRQESVTDKFGQ